MKNFNEIPFDVKVFDYISTIIFTIVGLRLTMGLIFWYVLNSSVNLNKIIIHGDSIHNNMSSFRKNIIPEIQGNFYTIHLRNTQQAFESLPWIRSATIKRVFPNQIEVYIQEHKPFAIWGSRDDLKMINANGAIFDSTNEDDEFDKFPQFIGPQEQSHLMLSMYLKLNSILAPLKVKLTKIELSSRGSWTAMLDGGAQLELGRGSDDVILERMKKFVGTLNMVTGSYNKSTSALQHADLRHSDGYALKINGVTTLNHDSANLTVKKN